MKHRNVWCPESLRLIGAALALQQASGTAAQIVPLLGTDRFVVIGTAGEVAQLLPAPGASSSSNTCAEMRALCSACGGTGEVHGIDGEWRGTCDCEATQPAGIVCDVPPPGWYCTRVRGHDGPCAAHRVDADLADSEGGHHD